MRSTTLCLNLCPVAMWVQVLDRNSWADSLGAPRCFSNELGDDERRPSNAWRAPHSGWNRDAAGGWECAGALRRLDRDGAVMSVHGGPRSPGSWVQTTNTCSWIMVGVISRLPGNRLLFRKAHSHPQFASAPTALYFAFVFRVTNGSAFVSFVFASGCSFCLGRLWVSCWLTPWRFPERNTKKLNLICS